jgi:hypothetical protein
MENGERKKTYVIEGLNILEGTQLAHQNSLRHPLKGDTLAAVLFYAVVLRWGGRPFSAGITTFNMTAQPSRLGWGANPRWYLRKLRILVLESVRISELTRHIRSQ